ncbi:MAG: short-chain fatty acyl-CoA regulator family protein [Neomegalonema sp.]|nr:short-chain fatty acyl-CoA regulator family protein [Neomegalonema sp.]
MARAPIGLKVRDRRKTMGVTQAALAGRLGISPSYLNLIENGKRSIGGGLLVRLAKELDVELEALDAASDRRLVAQLHEALANPIISEHQPDAASATEFVGRHPEWAAALVALHRGYLDRDRLATALSVRINQDPFLSEAVHQVLTNVAAIRSASEILHGIEDIEPDQARRFYRILVDESGRLTEISRAMAAFFDGSPSDHGSISPAEEVDDLLIVHGNYFPSLEIGANALRSKAKITDERVKSRLIDYLSASHGVSVERVSATVARAQDYQHFVAYDAKVRRLEVLEGAPETSKRFELAKLAASWALDAELTAILDKSEVLSTPVARMRARNALASYAASAMLMPYEPFLEAATAARYDIDVLARQFGASYEQVAHRCVTLRRPGAEGIPFAFMRADPSGFVSKRFPLPGLALPRHGGACPLWVIYRAFQTPDAIVRQLAEFPGGERFLFFARALSKEGASFDRPRHLMSVMLACGADYADQVVYSDGLAIGRRALPEPVGPSCGLCARQTCSYRQEAALFQYAQAQNGEANGAPQ